VLFKKRPDAVFLTHENDGNTVLRGGLNGTLNFDCGRMVAAHRIDCDLEVGHEELFLGCFDHFPIFVIAAVRTSAVRHAQFVTIGTFGEGSRGQMIVRPPAIAPRF
jgi:hypothetical protein